MYVKHGAHRLCPILYRFQLPRQHTLQLQEGYALQFRPICDLLTHFADVKKSITLKVRVRQMVEVIASLCRARLDWTAVSAWANTFLPEILR